MIRTPGVKQYLALLGAFYGTAFKERFNRLNGNSFEKPDGF
jgi:hypothetical protein